MGKPVQGISGTRPIINSTGATGSAPEMQMFGGDTWKLTTSSPEELIAERARLVEAQKLFQGQAATGAEDVVRSLPVQGNYSITTETQPRIATVLDQTDRIPGPSPIQTTSWKSSNAANVGKKAWEQLSISAEGKAFDKKLSQGLRRATEESVGKALGTEYGAQLSKTNSELGQILSSRERALLDAEQEMRKNAVTSVDGMIAGALNPVMLAVKKLADISKMTGPRTVTGKALVDLAKSGALDPLIKVGAFETILHGKESMAKSSNSDAISRRMNLNNGRTGQ